MGSIGIEATAILTLIQEVHRVRPPYGIVVLANRVREHVPFTEELEQSVNQAMAELRQIHADSQLPGPRWFATQCRAYGYFPVCCVPDNRTNDFSPPFGQVGDGSYSVQE